MRKIDPTTPSVLRTRRTRALRPESIRELAARELEPVAGGDQERKIWYDQSYP